MNFLSLTNAAENCQFCGYTLKKDVANYFLLDINSNQTVPSFAVCTAERI